LKLPEQNLEYGMEQLNWLPPTDVVQVQAPRVAVPLALETVVPVACQATKLGEHRGALELAVQSVPLPGEVSA
jgi:hypothetical protein